MDSEIIKAPKELRCAMVSVPIVFLKMSSSSDTGTSVTLPKFHSHALIFSGNPCKRKRRHVDCRHRTYTPAIHIAHEW
jgi:hypothetical protein